MPAYESSAAEEYPSILDEAMVAQILMTDGNQIRKWANAGVLPCRRVPGTRRYLFLRDEVMNWLDAQRDPAT